MMDHDANGNPIFIATDLSVEVKPSSLGKYGYIAEITENGNAQTIEDVKLDVYLPKDLDIANFIDILRPDIDYSSIMNVRIGNVGVEANTEDSNGIFIMELLTADGSVLGKIAQVGWGIGNCQ